MKKFVVLPNVKSINDVRGLRKLFDTVESSVRNLKSLKVQTNSYGSLLVPLLNEKLPPELRLQIARKFENEVWSLDDMMTFLKRELVAKENSLSVGTSFEHDKSKKVENDELENPFTAFNLLNSSNRNKNKNACVFCNLKNHKSNKCLRVTEPAARKEILKQNKNCFICFSIGHTAKNCTWEYKCNKCNGKHNICICTFSVNQEKPNFNPQNANPQQNENNSTANNLVNNRGNVLLQTAYVNVSDLSVQKETNAIVLFDSGSQRTYISNELKNLLNLPVLRKESIVIQTFGNKNSCVKSVDIVPLKLFGNSKTVIIEAISTPFICSDILNQNVKSVSSHYKHLQNLQLADNSGDQNKHVSILIGMDYYFSFMNGEVKKGNENEPLAIKSIFGWVLCGVIENEQIVNTYMNSTHMLRVNTESIITYCKENSNDASFNKLFYSENIDKNCDINDDVFSNFKKNLSLVNNRYISKLPFKEYCESLPDNYYLAMNRLKNLQLRLDKDKELQKQYDDIIKSYINDGIVEIIDKKEPVDKPNSIHYLPHRAVVRKDRDTTKVRIVFDASAHLSNQPSLNDTLYAGPCLLPLLFDILIRFRIGKIGIVADLRQAFLQIEIDNEHRNFLRFLWFDDISLHTPADIILRFARLPLGHLLLFSLAQ